jgi:hypothetical protein
MYTFWKMFSFSSFDFQDQGSNASGLIGFNCWSLGRHHMVRVSDTHGFSLRHTSTMCSRNLEWVPNLDTDLELWLVSRTPMCPTPWSCSRIDWSPITLICSNFPSDWSWLSGWWRGHKRFWVLSCVFNGVKSRRKGNERLWNHKGENVRIHWCVFLCSFHNSQEVLTLPPTDHLITWILITLNTCTQSRPYLVTFTSVFGWSRKESRDISASCFI